MKFNKDAFVQDAIFAGYLRVDQDGRVYKNLAYGKGAAEWREIPQRTHKASGRVYFQLSWRITPRSSEIVRKSVLTNRAVALRYLPNPLGLPQVNHIDGVKAHNYLKQPTPELIAQWGPMQLEWSSGQDNERHAHANGLKSGRGSQNANVKLTADQVVKIRERVKDGAIWRVLATEYGVSRSTIVSIVNRRTWDHV